ncbi:T9SS type A sorting domain-containing protein [uncultured Fluviicola sp.]|uniref:Ig-like domain-containing protein n=1 Tax=uncultured Fluviicola sp. TaxID=463303 RepID=UPI0025E1D938|nr:T9SS type A sorting domain-containing protein [uncultured Fluviicola sp.]
MKRITLRSVIPVRLKFKLKQNTLSSLGGLLVGLFLIASNSIFSQTTLINPATDGGFELGPDFTSNGWTVDNGTVTNKWFVGTAATGFTGNAAYISADAGVTNGYTNSSTSVVHFYRDVTFPAGETNIQLSFNWKALGESGYWDALMVSIAPTSYTPVATNISASNGNLAAPAINLAGLWNSSSVNTATISIPASVVNNCSTNQTFRLIFTWKNDGGGGSAPSAAVDNISLVSSASAITSAGGTFTIDNTLPNAGTNFSSFTNAINALNSASACLTAPVVFNVTSGQTFNELPPVITATGTSTNTITFQKNGAGVNPKITSTGTTGSNDASITLSGGDYFRFDGIDVDNSASASMEFGYLVRNASATDGAMNNIFRNISVKLNRGNNTSGSSSAILFSASTTGGGIAPTALSGANSDNQVMNVTIDGAINGIYFLGNSTYPDANNSIGVIVAGNRNLITNIGPTVATFVAARGVYLLNQNGVSVKSTDVSLVASNQAISGGIYLAGVSGNTEVSGNSIKNISVAGSTSTTSVAYGLFSSQSTSGTNVCKIHNNMVSDIYTSFTGTATSNRYAIGIFTGTASAAATQSYLVYHNNVSIGNGLTPTYSNSCYEIQNVASVYKVQNNIFANFTNAQTGAARHYVYVTTSATNIGATGSISNKNDFFVANDLGTTGFTARANSTNLTSLLNWTSAITAVANTDANSANVNPMFVNNNTDLHLNLGATPTQIESGGEATLGIAVDFDGQVRPGPVSPVNGGSTAPDMGADEFDGAPATPPTITFNSITPNTVQCAGTPHLISVDVANVNGTISSVNLNYSVNGVTQTPIAMTNSSGSTWEGTIAVPSPANATVSWSVTATNSLALSGNYIGTSYSDEPLLGVTASATASSSTICESSPSVLTATLTKSGSATIGTATTLTGATSQPTAFCNRWPSYRMQTIFTAAELSAAGLIAGPITSMSYNITTLGDDAANANFVVKIGTTGLTAFTDFVSSAAYTTVYPAATYTHAVGVNVINFSTPYNWDGTSNIVVEVSHDGADAINNSQTYYTATPGNTVVWSTSGNAVGTTSTNRLNVVFTGNVAPAIQTISWSDGVGTIGTTNPLSVSPATTTTYTATITAAGCSVSPSPTVTVTVNPLPSAPTAANSTQCGTQIPTASVTSTSGLPTPEFKWYDAAVAGTVLQSGTSTTYTTAISATTTFYVSELNTVTGCESARVPVTVTVSVPDAISASASAAAICLNGSVNLTAANTNPTPMQNYTYSWVSTAGSGAETPVAGNPVTITPTDAGSYTYTVTAVDGGCTTVNTVSVTVNPSPTAVTAASSAATICNGDMIDLTSSANPNTSVAATLTEGFETFPPSAWTMINAGSGNAWSTSALAAQSGSSGMAYVYDPDFAANAWAITPQLYMVAGQTYNISFWYKVRGASFPENLKVTVGNAATTAAQTSILWDNNGGASLTNTTWAQGTTSYTPSVTGNYYVGFNCYSGADEFELHVDDVSIEYTEQGTIAYAWTSAPAGFTSAVQNPMGVSPVVNTTYTVTATNSFNCSASASVAVIVNQPSSSSVTASSCDSYTWAQNGMTYMASGAYTDTIPNMFGCDSVITLNLTINQPTTSTVSVTECSSYTWAQNGMTYTASGMYTDTIPNSVNCDSVITLDLTINMPTSSVFTVSTCSPTYTWAQNGTVYNASGMYNDTLSNASGCDSVVTLNLTITNFVATATDNGDATITASAGTTYQWINCTTNAPIAGATAQTFAATANGTYAVIVSNGTCSDTSNCVNITNVGIKENMISTISVHPNPTNDVVIVTMDASSAIVEVMDVQGKLVQTAQIKSGDQVDLSTYERGVYTLRIKTESGTSIERIVKN